MTNKEKAKQLGIIWAENMYQFWQTPGKAGPTFDWNLFPRSVAHLAETNCFAGFSDKTKNMKELEQIAKEAAFQRATMLVSGKNDH